VIDLRSVRSLGFDDADAIGRKIIALHKASEFDVCTLFFSRFKSVISQIPTAQQIIPLALPADAKASRPARLTTMSLTRRNSRGTPAAQHFDFRSCGRFLKMPRRNKGRG